MISAFGVEHGEVSKAFRKLGLKLAHAEVGLGKNPVSMHTRTRENYAQWRAQAGVPGPRSRGDRIKDKEGAQAMVTSAGNQSRRAGRKLP